VAGDTKHLSLCSQVAITSLSDSGHFYHFAFGRASIPLYDPSMAWCWVPNALFVLNEQGAGVRLFRSVSK
jgi:hypothetical protein